MVSERGRAARKVGSNRKGNGWWSKDRQSSGRQSRDLASNVCRKGSRQQQVQREMRNEARTTSVIRSLGALRAMTTTGMAPQRSRAHKTDTAMTLECSTLPSASSSSSARFQPALRNVAFCSCYVYSPRGNSFGSAASRQLCARLKLGDAAWLPSYAGVVRELTMRHEAFAELLTADAVLVPVPGSDPSTTRVWAAERLAVALHGVLLGNSVWLGVRRRFPVRKSATALNADRPTTQQHFESLSVQHPSARGTSGCSGPPRIVLIDDVITKGRTILAAAARLHETFPDAYISAFALVRTMGFLDDVSRFLEPCAGFVRWGGGDARREP